MNNRAVIERLQQSQPWLIGLCSAAEAWPAFAKHSVLHAGPPIALAEMPGPMRGAVVGSLVYEGLDPIHIRDLIAAGEIRLVPCSDVGFAGPMAGVVTSSMPVWIVEDNRFGNRAYAPINEGLGKVLRFGAHDNRTIERLKWMQTTLSPILDAAVRRMGGIDLTAIMAEGLRRGDELHNRNKATTAQLARELAPHIAATSSRYAEEVLSFLRDNDHFFLNISIAASKCRADAAHAVGSGSVVTAMCANGREFGIRVSGLGSKWLTGPAGTARGSYFDGFSREDACGNMGDSYISEVVGLGGFAMAAAPAIAGFIGGRPSEFVGWTEQMYEITLAEHEQFVIPALDYRGVPLGIDVRRVVDSNILPVLNSGIAHKRQGVGQIGAGLAHPPMECFVEAVNLLAGA